MSCHACITCSWHVIISSLKYSTFHLTLIVWFSTYFFGLYSVSSTHPDLGLHTLIKKISTVPVVSVNIYLLMPPKSVSPVQISLMSSRPIGEVSQYFPGLVSSSDSHQNCTNEIASNSLKPTPFLIFPFSVNENTIHPETGKSSFLDYIPSWLDDCNSLLTGLMLPFMHS